jgi:ABC-2 type transport system ATP-binding protein
VNVIETRALTKVYPTRMKRGDIVALDQVSLEVFQGEVFGLLGPNGAGKTTFIKTLLGITGITSGEALLNGLPPTDPMSRDKVGFLPENHRFPGHLTGLGLLEFTSHLYGLGDREIETRCIDLLKLVDMERWASTKIRKYSKGMAQRIGLAQALVADPDVVLLDEPTDGVDPVGKLEIREVFRRLREQGKTVFLNSHLLSEVEAIADRVAILSRGKLVRVGTVTELTTKALQYEIEAEIGDETFTIPEDIGKRVSISTSRLIVELNNWDDINKIIDELRIRRILIRSVKPLKQTLEQSFYETVSQDNVSQDSKEAE